MKKLLLLCFAVSFLTFSCQETKQKEANTNEIKKEKPTKPKRVTPVEKHGHLHIKGKDLLDKNNEIVTLRGVSFFWSQWGGRFYTRAMVKRFARDWGVSVIRASIASDSNSNFKGYAYSADSATSQLRKLDTLVQAAKEEGVYVIIDYHSHDAHLHVDHAKAFFTDVLQKYAKDEHVLFETFNEPEKVAWKDIKDYHQTMVDFIREKSDNVVICGTPIWSQLVNDAAKDPVEGKNVAYTLHFYAGSDTTEYLHKLPEFMDRVDTALHYNKCVFATEFGISDPFGMSGADTAKTTEWMVELEKRNISYAMWAVMGQKDWTDQNRDCGSCIFTPEITGTGDWKEEDLKEAGLFIRSTVKKHNAEFIEVK